MIKNIFETLVNLHVWETFKEDWTRERQVMYVQALSEPSEETNW